jgi:hypothetical protein
LLEKVFANSALCGFRNNLGKGMHWKIPQIS